MEFHGRIYGIPRDERRRRIEDLLAVVELDARRDERTKNLSGGMKRRLQIARGLLTRPEVLFLDEPTLGLDPQTRMRIWDYIRQVNQAGTTIFMTTHYMEEADMLSDRISIMDHGRIVISGTPDELKNTLGEDVVYLETGDDSGAREFLLGMEEVRSITGSPRGLSVAISADGSHALPRIIDRLREAGIEIVSVNLKKPTMDDVFVHYTGRGTARRGRVSGYGMGVSYRLLAGDDQVCPVQDATVLVAPPAGALDGFLRDRDVFKPRPVYILHTRTRRGCPG